MSTEYKIMNIENRIALLAARGKDNGRVIAKLKRRLKNLKQV